VYGIAPRNYLGAYLVAPVGQAHIFAPAGLGKRRHTNEDYQKEVCGFDG
jgi:hypothetical protein